MFVDHIWAPSEVIEGKPGLPTEVVGVHAWKAEGKCINYAISCLSNAAPFYDIAVGQVALWGDVIEYDFGYRAQYGKVIAIKDALGHGIVTRRDAVLGILREKYGISEKPK